MAFDQNIQYRVSVDDSQFQAKLTQMRASLDSTVNGGSGFGRTMAFMGPMGNFGGGMSMQGGLADFGAQVQPVTYTPPAIAMQPHFGMFQINQTLTQAGLASAFGPAGIGLSQLSSFGMFPGRGTRDVIPPNMSYSEYINYSTRALGDRAAAMGTAAMGAGFNLAANTMGGAAGAGLASYLGMGAIGTLGLSMAGGMAFTAPVAAAADRAADNIAIQSALASGSFRFYQGGDTDSVTGRGFGRTTRANISNAIMKMEASDARFNTTDYRQILEGGMQMDLFSGTRDADDFKQKFKGLVETVKTVSSTLHTSLREGLETIRGLRDMGVTDPVAQQSMVLRAETMGRASGRTGMEMMQIGQAGAEMFRGTGISMQRGFELNQQNATMVRQMLNSGAISRDTVAHAGGELSLAQQMSANALGSFQTTMGRGFMMAAFNSGNMSLDPNMIAKVAGGDVMSGMSNAAAVMSNPGNMIRFQAHQHDMISKMNPMQMQAFSIAQTAATANQMMSAGMAGDASFDDTYMAMGLRAGKSHEILKTELGMLRMNPLEMRKNMETQMGQMSNQMMLENKRDGIYGYKFVANAFTRAVTNPIAERMSNFGVSLGAGIEDTMTGIRMSLTGETDTRGINAGSIASAKEAVQARVSAAVADAKSRGITDQGELEKIAAAESAKIRGGGTVRTIEDGFGESVAGLFGSEYGGAVSKLKAQMTGDEAEGTTVSTKEGIKVNVFGSKSAMEEYAKTNNVNLVNFASKGGKFYAYAAEDMGSAVDARRKMHGTDEDKEYAKKKYGTVSDSDIEKILEAGGDIAAIGKVLKSDFSMEDFRAGKLKGKTYEAMAQVAAKMGLSEEFEKERALGEHSSLIQKSGKLSADEYHVLSKGVAEQARYQGSGKLSDLLSGDKSAAISGAVSKYGISRNAAKAALLGSAGLSMKEADEVLADLDKMNKGGGSSFKSFLGNVDKMHGALLNMQAEQAQSSNSDLAATSGLSAGIGPKEMEAMNTMAKNLEVQMNTLIALQEKLQAVMKKGAH